jgi:hypothetical protein
MFAVAERYSNETPLPEDGKMWTAGNEYLERAREVIGKRFLLHRQRILIQTLFTIVATSSLSRPDIIQALLLLGYREIGMGTMAQAWLYLGLAIRVVGVCTRITRLSVNAPHRPKIWVYTGQLLSGRLPANVNSLRRKRRLVLGSGTLVYEWTSTCRDMGLCF